VRLPTMDWNWKVTLPLPLHGKAHVVNVVHAYMSPPSSAVMGEAQFGRNLSVAYYPRLPVHLDQRRRSAQSCWWMTTPSLGNREHPFRPLDPSTITEPVSIKTIPPNGVVNRPFISRLGKLSLEGCAPLASLCSKLRDVPYRMTKKFCLCSTCVNSLRSDKHRTKFVAADCATLRVARQRHMLGSVSVVCDLYLFII
jgi:hypothetical protein